MLWSLMRKWHEPLEIVDEQNRVVGQVLRSVAHTKGVLHRAVNVFVFNSDGYVLMQQRSDDKDVCPSAWDLSAAEHLKPGESYEQAAMRSLREELRIVVEPSALVLVHGPQLHKHMYDNGRVKDYEFAALYRVVHDGVIDPNKREVKLASYFTENDVEQEIRVDRGQFTPWFMAEWPYVQKPARPV